MNGQSDLATVASQLETLTDVPFAVNERDGQEMITFEGGQ